MASISSALNLALAGLSVSAAQSAVVARNVGAAGDENYTRKSAVVQTLPGMGPMVSAYARSSDRQLLEKLMSSASESTEKQVITDALNRLAALSGDPQDGQSIAAQLNKLQQTLRVFESNPSNSILGQEAIEAARAVALNLNGSSSETSQIRSDADQAIAESVERVNTLLTQFKVVNDGITRGVGTASDLTESLDQRDAILRQLSEEIGIRTIARPNNDLMIQTESGIVLFEGSPRQVAFAATQPLLAGMEGAPIRIDGVIVTGETASMTLLGGRLAALTTIRDQMVPRFSLNLDQIAAGLIISFAEADPSNPPFLPVVDGLFVGGNGSLPSLSDPLPGLAGQLRLNPLGDPDVGGSVILLRDGGFGGASYTRNSQALPGYQTRIEELVNALDSELVFPTPGGGSNVASLKTFASLTIGQVESTRRAAQQGLDMANATRSRTGDALSRISGVNIDQEMAALLELEKSYQAASKVLATVDSLLMRLMDSIR